MRAALLIAALLLPAPLLAQDETLQPNGDAGTSVSAENDSCAQSCSVVACDGEVDEGQASPDNLEVSTTTNSVVVVFQFPTPASNPSTAASAQTFDFVMSRCDDDASCTERSAGTDPPFDAAAYCGATFVQQLFTGQSITATDQLHSGSWTFNTTSCASDGSDVEVRITLSRAGGGGNRNYACIEAVDWDVTHAGAAPAPKLIVVGR